MNDECEEAIHVDVRGFWPRSRITKNQKNELNSKLDYG